MSYIKSFLLPLFLLFTVLIVKVVHVTEPEINASSNGQQERLVSNEELLTALSPLLVSGSVERAAAYIDNESLPFAQKLSLLEMLIVDDSYQLSHEDATQLVLAIANTYPRDSSEQYALFDLFVKHADLLKKTQPLYLAVKYGYRDTVLPLQAWAAKVLGENPGLKKELRELKYHALMQAADTDDLASLKKEVTRKGVFPEDATELVWYIASTGKGASLLAQLKKLGADLNDERDDRTPLITAAMENHPVVVEQLIALKADLNKSVNPKIGNALHQAIEKEYAVAGSNAKKSYQLIESMLRKAGARE